MKTRVARRNFPLQKNPVAREERRCRVRRLSPKGMTRPVRHPVRQLAIAVAALVAVTLTACGTGNPAGHSTTAPSAPSSASPFAWLAPAAVGGAWRIVRLPSGAELARPPGWRPVHSDSGTASFAVRGPSGAIVAYLNATPRQGAETPANWATFRVHHNADEGSRDIRTLAAARGLRFRSGPGSCVIDQYRTSARAYREIACLVAAPGRATVVVGAATPGLWAREAPVIERAISAFRA